MRLTRSNTDSGLVYTNFEKALAELEASNPTVWHELPKVAQVAAELDPQYPGLSLTTRFLGLLGLSEDEVQKRVDERRRAHPWAKDVMDTFVRKGIVQRVDIASSLIDDPGYSRVPNQDGYLYRLVPPAVTDPSTVALNTTA